MTIKRTLSFFWAMIFLTFLSVKGSAQEGRVSEAVINIQKIFIDACREKILGNYESAATLYLEVMGKDPRNDAAAYELARVYDVMDRDGDALSTIQLAVSINPVNSWYQIFLADVYEKQDDFEAAAAVYAELIDFFPSVHYYYYKQAFYLVRAKESIKAIKVYNRLEQEIGITEDLTKKKFQLYIGNDNVKKATHELVKLTKAYPSDVDYKLDLANYYLSLDKKDLANKVYKDILLLDPSNGIAALAISGKTEPSANLSDSRIANLKPIFDNPNTDIDVKIKQLIPVIQKVADERDPDLAKQAIMLVQGLEDIHPQEAKVFAAYGDLLFYTGDRSAALEKYKRATQLDKSVFAIWQQQFYIYEEYRDYRALLDITNEAKDYFPNKMETNYFGGIAQYGLGNFEEASSQFKQTALMSRSNPVMLIDVQERLGLAYGKQKKYSEANAAFEKGLSIDPNYPSLLTSYASILAQQKGQEEKALELVKKADDTAPNNSRVQSILAKVYLSIGSLSKAQSWIEKAIANGGSNAPSVLEISGDIKFQLRDLDGAKKDWKKALELGGQPKLIQEKIDHPEKIN